MLHLFDVLDLYPPERWYQNVLEWTLEIWLIVQKVIKYYVSFSIC